MLILAQIADIIDGETLTWLSVIWVVSASLITLFLIRHQQARTLRVVACLALIFISVVHFMSPWRRFLLTLGLMFVALIELIWAVICTCIYAKANIDRRMESLSKDAPGRK